jgi:hypothetical protein
LDNGETFFFEATSGEDTSPAFFEETKGAIFFSGKERTACLLSKVVDGFDVTVLPTTDLIVEEPQSAAIEF